MTRILISVLLILGLCAIAGAQEAQDATASRLLGKSAKNGKPLQTLITVNASVHAQAVLIPRERAWTGSVPRGTDRSGSDSRL